VSDNLVQNVDQKVCERWGFPISEISYEFPQISHSALYEIIKLSQVLCKMGSKNAHRCTENAENGISFDFFERYHKDVYEFLSHIVLVTGDET
jgi:hypothetical protein